MFMECNIHGNIGTFSGWTITPISLLSGSIANKDTLFSTSIQLSPLVSMDMYISYTTKNLWIKGMGRW
ncbi:hypothetical protein RchiOBHm_Chr1g0365971 [Rosa chinensis]|uniref:Uncharacterized protein n=1 Tax=Rosa chinensis TaxID=74649 RepID=A0A2P6SK54_ROSCH|nr:hypothetical protein RchiOBHm_Chr1g0365971 [Rosa chinensis]